MLGWGNRNNNDEYEPQDVLCVFKDDGTADIANVVSINDERILAGPFVGEQYAIPIQEVKVYNGPRGRIFLYPSTVENVVDCQRIAALERSTVLRQITMFAQDELPPPSRPINRLLILAAVVVVLIIIILLAS